jgi:predicted component of type VI protein secretion system
MSHLYFLMRDPGKADRVLVWDTRTLSIGRSSENDLTIEDEEISRKHAMLLNENGVCEIGDYRTGNGTFVNGERVDQKQSIKPGDVIGIGKLQLEFCQAEDHPAKLGHKLEFASQLKTVGMLPQGADAGTTMLGMADTTPPGDDFVIEPERSTGEHAFMVGADAIDEFQVRDLDASLDDMDVGFDDDLELMDLIETSPALEPPPAVEPPRAVKPQQAVRPPPAARPPRAAKPAQAAKPPQAAPSPRAAKRPPPAPDQNGQTGSGADPMERLRKLKMMHDEGLITDDEFQATRTKILNEM